MWCWKRIEGIIWTDLVINAGVLQKVKGNRNVLQKTKCNSFCKILHRNCLLKCIIDGKIEGRI